MLGELFEVGHGAVGVAEVHGADGFIEEHQGG